MEYTHDSLYPSMDCCNVDFLANSRLFRRSNVGVSANTIDTAFISLLWLHLVPTLYLCWCTDILYVIYA